jgi:tetratricopeptide (TPR) repeat protein
MRRRRGRVDLRGLFLAGMLVVVGALVIGADRPARVASARLPVFPQGRFAPGDSLPDQQIRFYQDRLADNSRDALSWDMLAIGYMRKLRESGDPGYALRAEESLRRALAADPRDGQASGLLAWVALVKHEFAGAATQAEALIRESPSDDMLYGILGDADVELGRYGEARQVLQRMMDLKPGPAAYTRAAYLRQLHGDILGAIHLMQFAVEAASPRDRENLAWTRVQLGNLYFGRGDLAGAETQYAAALRVYPGYLYALAGLGGVRGAQGRFDDAIPLYEQSLAVIPLPVVAEALGDLYVRLGRREEAERQFSLVEYIGRLTQLNRAVYNRDLAYFYADHRRHLDQAVALAEREATQRHDVYTDDTLAWADFQVGRYAEADRLMARALSLGTRDALLLYHAGMIARGLGDHPRAARYLAQALRTNPYFHTLHAGEARRVLHDLRPGMP